MGYGSGLVWIFTKCAGPETLSALRGGYETRTGAGFRGYAFPTSPAAEETLSLLRMD